eukprot:TRINITY_DN4373_c0_g1_i1.p1 TRINITY_DN4373_c0_g1~~TRINITY_DN4373_c0_g1_i1.p1  ORF type:complete len:454 (+),score=95.38 TRINITY_DN4373_c0_g1_i1:450-1811(+)
MLALPSVKKTKRIVFCVSNLKFDTWFKYLVEASTSTGSSAPNSGPATPKTKIKSDDTDDSIDFSESESVSMREPKPTNDNREKSDSKSSVPMIVEEDSPMISPFSFDPLKKSPFDDSDEETKDEPTVETKPVIVTTTSENQGATLNSSTSRRNLQSNEQRNLRQAGNSEVLPEKSTGNSSPSLAWSTRSPSFRALPTLKDTVPSPSSPNDVVKNRPKLGVSLSKSDIFPLLDVSTWYRNNEEAQELRELLSSQLFSLSSSLNYVELPQIFTFQSILDNIDTLYAPNECKFDETDLPFDNVDDESENADHTSENKSKKNIISEEDLLKLAKEVNFVDLPKITKSVTPIKEDDKTSKPKKKEGIIKKFKDIMDKERPEKATKSDSKSKLVFTSSKRSNDKEDKNLSGALSPRSKQQDDDLADFLSDPSSDGVNVLKIISAESDPSLPLSTHMNKC